MNRFLLALLVFLSLSELSLGVTVSFTSRSPHPFDGRIIDNAIQSYEADLTSYLNKNDLRQNGDHQNALPEFFLEKYRARLQRNAAYWRQNVDIIRRYLFLTFSPTLLLERRPESPTFLEEHSTEVGVSDYSDVHQILAHISRDWGANNARIRQASYARILDELDSLTAQFFSHGCVGRDCRHTVLVPGSGLGRLAFDTAQRGYYVEACESSLLMWAASRHIVNEILQFVNTGAGKKYQLYPFISRVDNIIENRPPAPELVPYYGDVATSKIASFNSRFQDEKRGESFSNGGSMLVHLGSLEAIFGNTPSKQFHAVVTSFFLDTGNIYTYLSLLNATLQFGGVWVNYGPLQYHSCSTLALTSMELKELVTIFGFKIHRWEVTGPLEYVNNPGSLELKMYKSLFFSARKLSR